MLGHTNQGLAAFVLAGGKSLRMGQDKAFVCWQGRTLLEGTLEVTHAVASSTTIIGARAKFEKYAAVVEDIYPHRGPLGGIHAALTATDQELNLILAVDLPNVTPALLSYLIGCAEHGSTLVTAPRLAAGWEPLCAVYRRPFASVAEAALRKGQNAIHPLLEAGSVRAIGEGQLAAAGFLPQMFRNFNTMMDLASAESTRHV
jgi:molybdopterin-guanine dinucleotide biosynthesis protein A